VSQFKVALIDKTLEQIPSWVSPELEEANIDFVYSNCESSEAMLALAKDVNVLWIYGGSRLASKENLEKLPNCCAVIRSGSGVDRIDVNAATQLGMVVVNTPHAHHDAVSDHTITLLFAVGRRITVQDKNTRAGVWVDREVLPTWSLRNKTIGLLGFGLIPRYLIKKLAGFDLKVLVYDPFVDKAFLSEYGAEAVDLTTLLERSDIVSVHTPLTSETHHLIGEDQLKRMKKDAILINTARGPVIQQEALVKALKEKWILGAGLDVFEEEPSTQTNPLMALDNIVLTPHTAGFSGESIDLTWRLSVEACIDLKNAYYPRSYVNKSVKPRVPLVNKSR